MGVNKDWMLGALSYGGCLDYFWQLMHFSAEEKYKYNLHIHGRHSNRLPTLEVKYTTYTWSPFQPPAHFVVPSPALKLVPSFPPIPIVLVSRPVAGAVQTSFTRLREKRRATRSPRGFQKTKVPVGGSLPPTLGPPFEPFVSANLPRPPPSTITILSTGGLWLPLQSEKKPSR